MIDIVQADCRTHLSSLDPGTIDVIFADPPYFLSKGGTTCKGGKRVSVDKADWDKPKSFQEVHAFNMRWLQACQRALKPTGTIWVSGTQHNIFSVGYAMQELEFKLLNTVTWFKPNASPNLACRYFTHSCELVIWAAPPGGKRYTFNYAQMKEANGGKQMRDMWEFEDENVCPKCKGEGIDLSVGCTPPDPCPACGGDGRKWVTCQACEGQGVVGHNEGIQIPCSNCGGEGRVPAVADHTVWSGSTPSKAERTGYPGQKPEALLERIILASSNEGALICDPFCGSGTTGAVARRLNRRVLLIDNDEEAIKTAKARLGLP